MARLREAELVAVVVEGGFVKARYDDDVAANTRQPAMEGDDFAAGRTMKGINAFAAQGRMFAPEPEQIAGETMLIGHGLVRSFKTGPINE